ncbi:MAG: HAD-IA family hydrolase [Pseudomonadota bacterium]
MEALIFDLDGTLIDSAPDIHAGVLDALQTEDLPPITYAQTRSFIGRGVSALFAQVRAALGVPDDPEQTDRMIRQFNARYETVFAKTVLYPNVMSALRTMKARGHTLALCTNKPEGPTHAALAHFGMTDLFAVKTFGDGPYARKPDPAPVFHILAALGTSNALYIGDSETDAQTAHAAEIPFLLFTEGYRKAPVDTLAAAAKFSDFSALPNAIQTARSA